MAIRNETACSVVQYKGSLAAPVHYRGTILSVFWTQSFPPKGRYISTFTLRHIPKESTHFLLLLAATVSDITTYIGMTRGDLYPFSGATSQ